MLTLVERQPRITPISWCKVMRLCRQARLLAAMWALARTPAQGTGTAR
jgi:hypothetical protein